GVVVVRAALPYDDERPRRIDGDRRRPLLRRGVGVHLELWTDGRPGGVVALREHPRAGAIAGEALPHHHRLARRTDSDRRVLLESRRRRVRPLLAAQGRSPGREALHERPRKRPVLVEVVVTALPRHQEVAGGGDRHVGGVLRTDGVRVDEELRALRAARRVEPPGADPAVGSVGAVPVVRSTVPDHHEVPVSVGAYSRKQLVGRGVVCDLELRADRREGGERSLRQQAGAQDGDRLHPSSAHGRGGQNAGASPALLKSSLWSKPEVPGDPVAPHATPLPSVRRTPTRPCAASSSVYAKPCRPPRTLIWARFTTTVRGASRSALRT